MIKLIAFACIVTLLFTACDRQKSAQGEPGGDTPEVASITDQVMPIDPEQLGFATRMPKTAEFYLSLHNPGEILNALIQADVTELIFELNEQSDTPVDKDERKEVIEKINEAAVKDAFLCIDHGAAWHVSTSGEFYQNIGAAQMKLGAQILSRMMNNLGEKKFDLEGEAYKDLMDDFGKDALKMVEQFADRVGEEGGLKLPSVYLGCTPPDGKMQEWLELWSDGTKSICEDKDYIETHRFEKYGTQFRGFRINMKGVIKELNKNGEKAEKEGRDLTEIEKSWEQAALKIGEKFKQLTLVIVCGEVDGKLVIYAGPDAYSLVLVKDLDVSLASRPEFSKLGGTSDAKLMALCFASDDFIKSFQAWRGYEKSFVALAEAFQNEKLPNSDKIVENFKSLAKLEQELQTREADPFLMMCMLDGGLRIEAVGGRLDRSLDYNTPLQFTSASESMGDDLFLRMHWKGNRAWKEMQLDYTEQIVGVVGNVIQGGYLAFLKENDEGAEWYEKSQKWYEELVEPEITRLWSAYRQSFRPSLGTEVAVVMDLNGGMPRVPNVPTSYLKEGKIPRVLYVRPVKDRAKLNEAYSALDQTAGNVMEYISILAETRLPKPDFLSAAKDDLTTWFYPFPMMTDDFVPGVSVSDSVLMVGSSKNFAQEFYATWKKETSSSSPNSGMIVDIHFSPMWDCAEQWVDLTEKEAKQQSEKPKTSDKPLKGDGETEQDEVGEYAPEPVDYDKARKILKRMRKFQSLHWHRRLEDGKMRNSLIFEVSE